MNAIPMELFPGMNRGVYFLNDPTGYIFHFAKQTRNGYSRLDIDTREVSSEVQIRVIDLVQNAMTAHLETIHGYARENNFMLRELQEQFERNRQLSREQDVALARLREQNEQFDVNLAGLNRDLARLREQNEQFDINLARLDVNIGEIREQQEQFTVNSNRQEESLQRLEEQIPQLNRDMEHALADMNEYERQMEADRVTTAGFEQRLQEVNAELTGARPPVEELPREIPGLMERVQSRISCFFLHFGAVR